MHERLRSAFRVAAETTPRSRCGVIYRTLRGIYFVIYVVRFSVPPNASASTPSRAPAHVAAGLADGGSGHADAINSCPKGTTPKGDLRDHAVRLRKRRGRHSLSRRCGGKGNSSNSDQSDHWFWCIFSEKHPSYSLPSGSVEALSHRLLGVIR